MPKTWGPHSRALFADLLLKSAEDSCVDITIDSSVHKLKVHNWMIIEKGDKHHALLGVWMQGLHGALVIPVQPHFGLFTGVWLVWIAPRFIPCEDLSQHQWVGPVQSQIALTYLQAPALLFISQQLGDQAGSQLFIFRSSRRILCAEPTLMWAPRASWQIVRCPSWQTRCSTLAMVHWSQVKCSPPHWGLSRQDALGSLQNFLYQFLMVVCNKVCGPCMRWRHIQMFTGVSSCAV